MFYWKIINNKLFKKLPTETVAGAALVVSVAGILSRLLGLVRDRLLASQFGAGDVLDIYYAAFRIPDLVYNLLVTGALSAAFIPFFTGLITKKKKKEAWQLAQTILFLEVGVVILVGVIIFLFIHPLIHLITPGFSESKLKEVIVFTKIMFISPIFLSMSAVFGGVLVSFKRFLAYSLAPIFYNIGIIVGILFLVPLIGDTGLAWGVVLGAFLHFIIQGWDSKKMGFKLIKHINWRIIKKDLKKIIILMLPRSLAIGVNQINLLIITIFASTLTSGSLAIFNLANNIQSIPLGLFGIPFAVAAFPLLSSLVAASDLKKFSYSLSRTMRRILFFVIPASIWIFILRAEIVRVILGGGKFNWEDTENTLSVLGILALSLFAQSLIPLFARAFYSLQDTRTPFFIAVVSELLNLLALVFFSQKYQVSGLGIAFSITAIFNDLLLFWFLRKRIYKKDKKEIIKSLKKIIVSATLSGIIVYFTRYFVSAFIILNTFWAVLFQLTVAGSLGIISFYLLADKLKIQELKDFKNSFQVKLLGKEENFLD